MKQVTIFQNNLNATVFAKSRASTLNPSKLDDKADKSLPLLKIIIGAMADKKAL